MFEKKEIGNLKGYNFLIPSYQRGYRWTKNEVTALMEDILEFYDDNKNRKYCLQPLIVKKLENGRYEVVDGQQRLTTIYIFMKIVQQEIFSATTIFELSYETRGENKKFLEELSDANHYDDSDINHYYISKAYDTIKEWLESQEDKSTVLGNLNSAIKKNVFFIWYEIPEDINPINIFTKVNLGKIPLTNAELIKALILNKNNFKYDENEKEITKQQLEISIEWDKIEQGLQEETFWYFLNEKGNKKTRIDLLFNLLAQEYQEKYNLDINAEEENFSFLVFLEMFNQCKENKYKLAQEIWKEAKNIYEEFREWYNDIDKYHLIGYLIATGTKISDIRSLTKGKRKSLVWESLLNKSKEKIKYSLEQLYKLDYYKDKRLIRKLFLLFNIATLITKSEKQYRFPFDIYKKEGWDIEHIHAKADDSNSQIEQDDTLGNLTLLDYKTNRSKDYQKAPFNIKRQIIIERESKGQFVPVCTKNIFLKVYSQKINSMENWEEQDKNDYLNAINSVLEKFFNGEKEDE